MRSNGALQDNICSVCAAITPVTSWGVRSIYMCEQQDGRQFQHLL
jgi:hypothetical protein